MSGSKRDTTTGNENGLKDPSQKKVVQALIEKALAGDQEAFTQLLKRHKRLAYQLAVGIVKNPTLADDLVQESFIKAFAALDRYNPQYAFTTWLCKIVTNHCLDHLRRKKIQACSLDEPIEGRGGPIRREIADWSRNPEWLLLRKQRTLSIDQAIDSLPDRYRRVIVLRHKEDRSYEDIADILNIPLGTVKAQIFRARELLKKKLKGL
jgi:RNA polymerase sigma-70 factor (ECF subfamily)